MKKITEAFNHSFEQVAHNQEPEFTIHGIGYRGKWGKDTMSIFLNDLQSVEDELKDTQTESIVSLKDEIASLKGQVEDLEEELKEAKAGE
jgi:cell division protein FtsB